MIDGLQVFAHRGVSSLAPENTIAAFAKCLEFGIEWFEFDVGISADSSLLVIHDDTVDRTSNGSGTVSEMSFDQIRRLDAGLWFGQAYRFERIPELATVVDMMNETKLAANLEIKPFQGTDERRQALLEGIAYATAKLKRSEDLLVSSFQPDLLQGFHEMAPEVALAYLVDRARLRADFRGVLADAKTIGCVAIHPAEKGLTETEVNAMKAEGFRVNVWTVNTSLRAQELQEWGVDGVFSDRPQDLIEG